MSDKTWIRGVCFNRFSGNKTPLPTPEVWEPSHDWLSGKSLLDFPSYMAIEITNTCNLQCKQCNYRYGSKLYTRERGSMKFDLFKKIADEAAMYKTDMLMNYDGEPLMNKDLLLFLRYATRLELNTYFSTNGTLFDKKFADEIVSFYKGSIFFSLDGSKKWMESYRIGAKYETVTGNLRYLIDANEQAGSPIAIGVSLCNLGQNADERQEFLETWLPLVNYVSMGEVFDKYGTITSEVLTTIDLEKQPICAVPWVTLGICHNGDVIPCSLHVTKANTTDKIFGNINNQSIKEVWNSQSLQDFRKEVATLPEGSHCKSCQRYLGQVTFPTIENNDVRERRNGIWNTFENLKKGGARHIR